MRALRITLALAELFWVNVASGQHANLDIGTPATSEQIRGWDIDVRPDGLGLPPGTGTVEKGEKIYAEQCAACHGEKGQNPAKGFDQLAGGKGTLATPRPVRTIGSNWPSSVRAPSPTPPRMIAPIARRDESYRRQRIARTTNMPK